VYDIVLLPVLCVPVSAAIKVEDEMMDVKEVISMEIVEDNNHIIIAPDNDLSDAAFSDDEEESPIGTLTSLMLCSQCQ